MAQTPYQKLADQLIEQKITQRVQINAGAETFVQINIPANRKVFLKGYGYSWFSTNTYTLSTGHKTFPTRSDQEGSPAIPVIYGNPFPVQSGGNFLRLRVQNGDSSVHNYDVVFYILTDEFLDISSTGGELQLATGGGAGVATQVSIYDSTGTTACDVITREDGKKALCVSDDDEAQVPAHSAVSVGVASTAVLAANANRTGAVFINDSANTIYLNIAAGAAALNTGIRLNANGGSFTMAIRLGNNSQLAITAISSVAAQNLVVTEYTAA